ncbi:MAG: mandelate racemase [Rhizobiales bacterium]|nr:mandelate racemase [Hyphomicrobiales bacterium]
MTIRRIRLVRLTLGYSGGLVLHTASSGAVPTLSEIRLLVEQDGELIALGSTRSNIAYLSGLPAETVEAQILAAARKLDWSAPPEDLAGQLDTRFPGSPAPVRMLFEMAAADASARAKGLPLATWLGAAPAAGLAVTDTNQTLFWQDDASLIERAEAYAARGFLQLKLRIGITAFDDDLRRLALLRAHLGPAARLSVDANGQWDMAAAPARLEALARLGIEYVEQPLPAGDWEATARIAAVSPVPIMLDESLSSFAAVEQLAATRAAPLAHLKLAKLGGLDRMMAAGRCLSAAGIGVMIGQMNEGVVSTLAAAHAALALGASLRELYGADHLTGDPATPAPRYSDGLLHLPGGPGLGLVGHPIPSNETPLWDKTL